MQSILSNSSKEKKEVTKTATTITTSKQRPIKAQSSSDEESSSDDDDEVYRKPSTSKQPEATTTLAALPVKPKELLDMITASKSIVKYVKLVRNIMFRNINIVLCRQMSTTKLFKIMVLLYNSGTLPDGYLYPHY